MGGCFGTRPSHKEVQMPNPSNDHTSGVRPEQEVPGFHAMKPRSDQTLQEGVVDVSVDRPAAKPTKGTRRGVKRVE